MKSDYSFSLNMPKSVKSQCSQHKILQIRFYYKNSYNELYVIFVFSTSELYGTKRMLKIQILCKPLQICKCNVIRLHIENHNIISPIISLMYVQEAEVIYLSRHWRCINLCNRYVIVCKVMTSRVIIEGSRA